MTSLEYPIIWPPLAEEIKPFRKYCKGLVLNAGSGKRELGLGERELNIDIVPDNDPDIIGDLHSIPLIDGAVDTIVSIAVLEHTKFPWIVTQEFYRILRPGGYGVIAVPFIQPQHACPDDYCRFTENGLVELFRYTGFEILETAHIHHFGQTVAWLLWEYMQENMPQNKLVLRLWMWLIRQLSKGTFLASDSSNTHNTHYVVVRKPGQAQQSAETKALLKDRSPHWFFPLLSCPDTRQSLHLQGDRLVSQEGCCSYAITNGRPILLPSSDPRTWKTVITREGITREGVAKPAARLAPASAIEPTPIEPAIQSATQGAIQSAIATPEATPATAQRSEPIFLSEQAFQVTFKSPFAERLKQANPSRIAVLATSEYEGIFKNGGVGTHYKTLSEQLTHHGWYVILVLCTNESSYSGTSPLPHVRSIFTIREIAEVLALQPVHRELLAGVQSNWTDYQSLCCLFYTQALSQLFAGLPLYVEFHEMYGAGYHTIQAKQCKVLDANCVVGVTMHSGCEWVYEANEWFAEEYPHDYKQLCDYEQFLFENADLTFFPSYYLLEKVKSYGWRTAHAQHMPYFVPILKQSSVDGSNRSTVHSALQQHTPGKTPIVFFGRLEMRKGIMTFIKALKLLSPELKSQVHVHFVGKVVQLHAGRFGALLSDQYIQQELEGEIPYTIHTDFYSEQANQFIRGLNHPIVCLASHQENFPNTGLEMGQLPVSLVVSDTGGFRETLKLVERSAGVYWFKPQNPFSLADMLSKAFFTQPAVPEVASVETLESINQQLWQQKLNFIEAALSREAEVQVSQPKVTIGITCYKLGKYLMDCLISVEAQTYDNLEVLILDDASPDAETQQCIEQAKSIFPTFQFIRAETNLGLGGARNRLIEIASGEYFFPLDADNRLAPCAVEKAVGAALHAQAEIVVSAMLGFGAASFIGTFKYSSIPALLEMNISGDACSLFSTQLLRKLKHPERRDCSTQDWCIVSAAIATGVKILHYPYPLYEYRMREDSMIQQASFSKERYYLRQYLAQIPLSEWSPRQIYMMMMSIQELNAQKTKLEAENHRARAEAHQTHRELEEVRQQLKTARTRLRKTQAALETAQNDLGSTKGRIEAMETSKFWKLRKAWFKVKKRLNLPLNE